MSVFRKKASYHILMFGMGDICYSSVDVFTSRLAASLRHLGCEVDILEVHGNKGYSGKLIRMLEENSYDAAVSFNSAGEGSLRLTNGEYLFDHYKVPFLLFFLDHPMDHIEKLIDSGSFFHAICIDRDHTEYIKKGFPQKGESFFALPGGIMPERAPELSEESFRKRRYDLVFTGSRTDLDEAGRRIEGISPALKGIAIDLLDLLLSEREKNMEQALDQVLTEKGIAASPVEAAAMEAMINSVNVYARAYVREETVRFIMHSGMPFDIFGFGWDAVAEDAGAGTVFHPGIPYGELPGLYSDSKLVLNVMPWFKNGSHDRIPAAMLAGAVPVTDHSILLDDWFGAGKAAEGTLIFYDIAHPETVPEIMERALADPAMLCRMAGRGYAYASENMTWDNTAETVMDIIGRVKKSHGQGK